MESKATVSDQTLRLVLAYQKLTIEDRDALDRLLGQLAELHTTISEVFAPPAFDR